MQALVLTLVELTGGKDNCDRGAIPFDNDDAREAEKEDQGPDSMKSVFSRLNKTNAPRWCNTNKY